MSNTITSDAKVISAAWLVSPMIVQGLQNRKPFPFRCVIVSGFELAEDFSIPQLTSMPNTAIMAYWH